MIELTGNELGWIIKLAEMYSQSEAYKEFMKKHTGVKRFVKGVLIKFHPNNFNPGNSTVDWYIIKGEDLARIRREEFDKGREEGSASMREDLGY